MLYYLEAYDKSLSYYAYKELRSSDWAKSVTWVVVKIYFLFISYFLDDTNPKRSLKFYSDILSKFWRSLVSSMTIFYVENI